VRRIHSWHVLHALINYLTTLNALYCISFIFLHSLCSLKSNNIKAQRTRRNTTTIINKKKESPDNINNERFCKYKKE
jgi:hypothetical protein